MSGINIHDSHTNVDLHCRRLSTLTYDENIECVHSIVQSGQQKSIQDYSEIFVGRVHAVFTAI
jgi:uncharacterized membrane protein